MKNEGMFLLKYQRKVMLLLILLYSNDLDAKDFHKVYIPPFLF